MAKKSVPSKMTLEQQAAEILRQAEECGVQTNFFFLTTFQRYQFQMKVLSSLEEEIGTGELMVEKEYVKGRKNIYVNPAINEYNKTAAAANGTVSTLISIVKTFAPEASKAKTETDLLAEFLGSR